MRMANHDGRATLLVDGMGVDVEEASRGRFASDPAAVFDRWDELRAWADDVVPDDPFPVEEPQLGAPSPRPRQVFGIALNYRDHAAESNLEVPEAPATFTKFATCIAGPDEELSLPGESVDWEVELVAVVGRRTHRVTERAAWEHVAGVTVGQDLSERRVQMAGSTPQFSLGKSFPGFGPTGPWLVTPDELPDRDDLELWCTLNGREVQRGRTSDMVFSVSGLVSWLSGICPLLPGDLIFTGTPPGVGMAQDPPVFLRPGDELVSGVDGIGRIRQRCVASA